ncbi:MAG: hypothetical protein NVS3B10_24000 [Polyangiales bacterium]
MIRIAFAGALVASLGTAPLQCGHGSDSKLRTEDDAGDALYALAQDFHAKGDEPASKQTLRYLVEHYPSNRHVPAARAELGGATASGPGGGLPGDALIDAGK